MNITSWHVQTCVEDDNASHQHFWSPFMVQVVEGDRLKGSFFSFCSQLFFDQWKKQVRHWFRQNDWWIYSMKMVNFIRESEFELDMGSAFWLIETKTRI